MTTVEYNGNTYAKIIPTKALFKSTMVHDVVTRGDVFVHNIGTGEFTIMSGDLYKKLHAEQSAPPRKRTVFNDTEMEAIQYALFGGCTCGNC